MKHLLLFLFCLTTYAYDAPLWLKKTNTDINDIPFKELKEFL